MASLPPRKLTPGAGQYSFVDTEEPTRPGVPKPSDRFDTMAHMFANMTPEERRDAARLLDNFYRCDASKRVVLLATSDYFAD